MAAPMNTFRATAQTEDEVRNPGQAEGDDQFIQLKDWCIQARDFSREWRSEECKDAYDLAAGTQWTIEDRAILREQLRMPSVFNYIDPTINSVSGYEVQNRQEIRYLPRQLGMAGVADVETAAAKWFRDQAMAEDEESDAFRDVAICGMGWVDTRLNYEDDPEGASVDERIDPMEMYWDPVAKKRNLEDRRLCFRAKEIPLSEAREQFPDAEDGELHAGWFGDTPGSAEEPHDQQEAKFYRHDQAGREAGNPLSKVLIIEIQWWEREQAVTLTDPQTQKIVRLPLKRYAVMQPLMAAQAKKNGQLPPRAVKSRMKVYYRAFLGQKVLEVGPCPYKDGFTMNPITAWRDRNKNTYYGLVRAMRDPQRWVNKFFSSLIHQFSTAGRGVMAEMGAVHNLRAFEQYWSRADAVKWFKDGALSGDRVKQLEGPQVNQGVMGMMQYAISAIPQVTGVNFELMGTAEKDQPGILEYQRKQAGMTILAPLFDGLRRFRKKQGKVLLHYIREYFSDGRLILIEGPEGKQYIPLIRNRDVEKYDIIVDDAPSSPNEKERTWLALVQLMPMLQNVADPTIWAEFVKFMPLPNTLTEKLSQNLQQKAQQGPPPPSPEQQAKIAQSQSAVARNIAGAIKDLSQAGVQGPGPDEDIKKQAVAS